MSVPHRSEPTPLSRSVLSDETYYVIRDLVLDHDLPPGNRVNIDSLSARLGVSPTPVREALARLESDGLVVKTPLRGYSTTPLLNVHDFVELAQFRALIEQWTAAHAAATTDEPDARRLRDELHAIRTHLGAHASGPDAYRALVDHDARFHGLIAQIAGNELIAQAFERTHFHLHFLRLYLASRTSDLADPQAAERLRAEVETWEGSDHVARTIAEHTAIADAIIANDSERAAELIREHIDHAQTTFIPIVELLSNA